MKVNYKEIFKLKVMLDNKNIPYEFLDRSIVMNNMLKYPFYQIIVYKPNQEKKLISVVQGYGTYGENQDLLEIQGCLTEKELNYDSVLGSLTAKEVFKRIKKHYYEKLEEK